MRLQEWGRIVKDVNTTPDVGVDEIPRQAKKFGNTVDKDGKPPTLSTKVKGKSTNVLFNLGITEGIVLKLERDKHMDVLHIMDTNEKHRVEVRGKKGYERGNYDAQDKLHQVLDRVGKAANISELINGETVSINPNHPQGPDAIRTAKDVLQTEAILKKKFNAMELALMEGGHSIEDETPKPKNRVVFNLDLFEEKATADIRKNYNEFARFCVETLGIRDFPKITMTSAALDRTFGYFDTMDQSITVSYNGRHQMDTMRTLAHELVHCKQREERKELDGSDGSPDENEANAMAGVLLRRWADKNPQLFSESVEIIDENFADGKVSGRSRPGRVARAGASCNGSVSELRKKASNSSGERARMYHWCANMKAGRQ